MAYKLVGGLAAIELLSFYLKQKKRPPSIRGVVETVHSLPDRMRLLVPILMDQPGKAADLQKAMGSIDAVASIRANPVTGSVVIQFDPLSVEPIILFGSVIRILGLDAEIGPASQPVLWKEINAAGQTAEEMVRTFSIGLMDIKTLITLLLVGVLSYRLMAGRTNLAMPGSATLVWWIANLVFLRGLK